MTLTIVYVATQAAFQGVMGASQIASSITALSEAVTACRQELLVNVRVPSIDSFGNSGLKPEMLSVDIEVQDVVRIPVGARPQHLLGLLAHAQGGHLGGARRAFGLGQVDHHPAARAVLRPAPRARCSLTASTCTR